MSTRNALIFAPAAFEPAPAEDATNIAEKRDLRPAEAWFVSG